MDNLPSIVRQTNLTYCWRYRNDVLSEPYALVARYDGGDNKKWYHQYQCVNGIWAEGTPTPLPIFGIHSLQNQNCDENIFIFEGEKTTEAAHHLGLKALTSMQGANNAGNADWTILGSHNNHINFVLVPDLDEPGKAYMRSVYAEIRKIYPEAHIKICMLPLKNKGDDLIDWLRLQPACPNDWDGYKPIDEPTCQYLKQAFQKTVDELAVPAEDFFAVTDKPVFIGPFEPIKDNAYPVKKCPIDELPQDIKNWIVAHAELMQAPIDYLAAPLLVYMGAIIGRKRGIRVRQGTAWVEFPNLWGMIIGRPSLMKSPSMKAMQKPLTHLMNRAEANHKNAQMQHLELHNRWKILKQAQENQCKKSLEKRLKDGHAIQLDQIEGMNLEPEPQTPKLKRYRTDDTTIEKLGELLIDNPQGLLLFRDELSGWLYSFEKMGRENDRPFFLESWSGKEDFYVDRIGRGSLRIPSLCVSIFGSIQPGPLMRYIQSAIKGGVGDDGFIQRFQIMVWPEISEPWRLVNTTPIQPLEDNAIKIFDYLDNLTFDPEGKPIYLAFDDEAQTMFDQWQTLLENRLRSDGLPSYLEAHLAKYKKLVPTLALIFELLGAASKQSASVNVGIGSLNMAIAWAEYLESHAEKIYNCSVNRVIGAAQSLLQRIQCGQVKEPFSARDIYHGKHWSGLASSDDVQEVLGYLCEQNYLMQQMVKTGGKPTTKYWVHPDIFK